MGRLIKRQSGAALIQLLKKIKMNSKSQFFHLIYNHRTEGIMWNKEKPMKEENSSVNSITVLGEGLKLDGNIEAVNDVRVDGVIIGNVSSKKKVMVGATGHVEGSIHANEVCVMGDLKGDLHVVGLVRIGPTGKYKGTIVSAKIQIEEGADVEATITKAKRSQEVVGHSVGKTKELDPAKPKSSPIEKLE
jgi:cytoskeletal protein CcmA (bactofilin family)